MMRKGTAFSRIKNKNYFIMNKNTPKKSSSGVKIMVLVPSRKQRAPRLFVNAMCAEALTWGTLFFLTRLYEHLMTCPIFRIELALSPFSCRSFSTVVPCFWAMEKRVSPVFTE